MNTARGKLSAAVTVKCDDALLSRLDARVRELEREKGVPLSRGMVIRMALEEHLGLRRADSDPVRARE